MMQKVHFRLTSVAQKRCCLRSLLGNVRSRKALCCSVFETTQGRRGNSYVLPKQENSAMLCVVTKTSKFYCWQIILRKAAPKAGQWNCETQKTVNTRNIPGMLLCCKKSNSGVRKLSCRHQRQLFCGFGPASLLWYLCCCLSLLW